MRLGNQTGTGGLVALLLLGAVVLLLLFGYAAFRFAVGDRARSVAEPFRDGAAIPAVIWTYWHDPADVPDIVRRCMDTWRAMNPSHTITVLDDEAVRQLTGFDIGAYELDLDQGPARRADLARLLVMERFGGIWMDASIVCTQPLAWVHAGPVPDLRAFYAPMTTNSAFPIPENWFFAAPPGSPFVRDWLQEALRMLTFPSEAAYVARIEADGDVDLQGLRPSLPYLVMHLCAMVVMQRNPGKYELDLLDSRAGPLMYLHEHDWQSDAALAALCNHTRFLTPIIKLRGVERRALEASGYTCDRPDNAVIHAVFR